MNNGPVFGKARAIAGNRCILGPDLKLAVGAFFMIAIPTILFDALTLPWAFENLSGSWILAIIVFPLEIISIGMFFRTSLSDPGVIPRPASLYCNNNDDWYRKLQPINPAKHQDVAIHGHLFKLKYCSTCCLYRPPRCVHCSVCDNCVSKFDHHCPWVGNCVGARNYRSFIIFISSTSLYLLIVMITSPIKFFTIMQRNGTDNWSAIFSQAWEAGCLTLYSLGLLWFVMGLSGYHSYLISTNQTTYEQIKGYYDDIVNPWDRGALTNFKTLFLAPTLPRLTNGEPFEASECCYTKIKPFVNVLPSGKVELSTPQGSANTTAPPASKSTINSQYDRSVTHMSSSCSLDLLSGQNAREKVSAQFQSVGDHLASPPTRILSAESTRMDDRILAQQRSTVRLTCSDCLRDVGACKCKRSDAVVEPLTETPTSCDVKVLGSPTNYIEEEEDLSWWLRAVINHWGAWGKSWSRTALGQSTCVLPQSEH